MGLEIEAYMDSIPPCGLYQDQLSVWETLDMLTHGSRTECGFGFNVSADGRYYLMTQRCDSREAVQSPCARGFVPLALNPY